MVDPLNFIRSSTVIRTGWIVMGHDWRRVRLLTSMRSARVDGQPLPVRLLGACHHQRRYAFPVFEAALKEFGLPQATRTDNGTHFASSNSLFNLSRLSVRWFRLGIKIGRIKPGYPPAKRPLRKHAFDLEARDPQAGRQQLAATAGQVRPLHRLQQQRLAAPSAQHAVPGRALQLQDAAFRDASGLSEGCLFYAQYRRLRAI
jgi:hypothetical protein